jgi:hypothetical protein
MSRDKASLLDLYLDELLKPAESLRFEEQLRDDPLLRSQAELQRRIDAAIVRAWAAPAAPALRQQDAPPGNPRGKRTFPRPLQARWLMRSLRAAIAALLLIGVGSVWVWIGSSGEADPYAGLPWRSMEMFYRIETQKGFEPMWACDTDQRFASTFHSALGQAMRLRPLPQGVRMLGLSYSHTLSPRTVCMLARANGTPVVVFADRLERDTPPVLSAESGLRAHRRAVGALVLYEVSPLESPRLLDFLEQVEMRKEWLKK